MNGHIEACRLGVGTITNTCFSLNILHISNSHLSKIKPNIFNSRIHFTFFTLQSNFLECKPLYNVSQYTNLTHK